MNGTRPMSEAMLRAGLSLRAAKSELSASEIHAMARFACMAHDALAFIRIACEQAQDQRGLINPDSILDFLETNTLLLKELSHEQHDQRDAA